MTQEEARQYWDRKVEWARQHGHENPTTINVEALLAINELIEDLESRIARLINQW